VPVQGATTKRVRPTARLGAHRTTGKGQQGDDETNQSTFFAKEYLVWIMYLIVSSSKHSTIVTPAPEKEGNVTLLSAAKRPQQMQISLAQIH
jgi:hypothetical protein